MPINKLNVYIFQNNQTTNQPTKQTNKQTNKQTVDWDIIARIKQTISIPVIANGGISCRDDVLRCLEHSVIHYRLLRFFYYISFI